MTMTSTVLQRPVTTATTTATIVDKQQTAKATKAATTRSRNTMAWSHEKLRFSCIDNIGLKQLWKLIALDTAPNGTASPTSNNHSHNNININNNNKSGNVEQPKDSNSNNINNENALELSAPATPLLLQQQTQSKPPGWMQLSGHPESIVPTSTGIVRKRIVGVEDSEVLAYQWISQEPKTSQIVPAYLGLREMQSQHYIELQDLLAGFKDPCVMDIKLGSRTFLESEVSNKTMRPDLYQKMIAVDASAPTQAEHEAQAITKLRYMLFRESLSSSHSKGFRIEALRLRGRAPVKDLKTCRTGEQISQTIEQFLVARRSVQKELIKRLKHMRLVIEQSAFFNRHEIVGSSIFIVYDDHRVGAWLIDFAKSRQLPAQLSVNHRSPWTPGNREEGLLRGMDELIRSFEEVYARSSSHRGCLKI
ncbi:inositol-trisphosphate 3-kinase homolog isoform X2 [Drosophila sulfurigaster albostrigata]|uniref:inositol-trisphosphate 3-kinase homolog isoform X2 n=1 Tax=Drosophila sulfurigaster albostrigata TaxID=89887 RepID=UPI002D21975B|nr:inositol-trisphosphate 3-kinase homolog isoform X2 [Drosophila sulfurigaster albostrigata]